MSSRAGKMFGEIWGTGEPSVTLTHPIEMQPLYLVWEINVLVREK